MPGLLDLPIEINQMIALEIENDTDLQSYRFSCRFANDAADGDKGSFWRNRFLSRYDAPSTTHHFSNMMFKKLYVLRREHLNLDNRCKANLCHDRKMLEVIRDLIAESFMTSGCRSLQDAPMSKNIQLVHKIITQFGLLDRVLITFRQRAQTDTLLNAIQLALTHAILTLKTNELIFIAVPFPVSQQVAYATASSRPLFSASGQIDLAWALHVAAFWRYQFLQKSEQLYVPYTTLPKCEWPQCWSKMLQDGAQKLGTQWKGCYAYLDYDEVKEVRRERNYDNPIEDRINGEDTGDVFQTLSLDYLEDKKSTPWPDMFERILRARSKPWLSGKPRVQSRADGTAAESHSRPHSLRFKGKGQDNAETFHATGWLNPLPPQHGIPGWQRMTMMKYYTDEEEEDDDDPVAAAESVDEVALWAYEGIVLPGGMIILGRWWHPNAALAAEEQYSGPFVLWNVDGSTVEDK